MAAITTAAIGVAGAGYQILQGERQRKQAQDALNEYDRQEIENVYKDVPISTVGSDLMREETARTAATLTNAARETGTRGVLSSIPRIQSGINDANRESQRYLDDQVIRRNYAIADDERRIQGMTENRENADLAGIGQQLEVGRQNTFSGIRALGSNLSFLGGNIDRAGKKNSSEETDSNSDIDANSGNNNQNSQSSISLSSWNSPLNTPYRSLLQLQEEDRLYKEAAPKNYGL